MALSRLSKNTKIPYTPKTTLLLPNPHSLLTKPFCTNTNITNRIISIFTKHHTLLNPNTDTNTPELDSIAPLLSTQVVETALNCFKTWKPAHKFFTWASNQSGYEHNIYTFSTMASILSRARQIAPMKELTRDIVNSRCRMSPGVLGFYIRCLGSVGLVDEANVLFDQVQVMGLCVPNVYAYNCLLQVLCRSGLVELVEERLREMTERGIHRIDKFTLTPVLQCYCAAGKFDKALDVFNQMFRSGWTDEYVLSILVLSFSKWGEVDKACELIKRMEAMNVRLNEKSFCVLIHGFVREDRVDKALELFVKMKKSGFCPDVSVYDALIGGFCKRKEIEKVLFLYLEMKDLGIKPDIRTISKLLTSFYDEEELTQLVEVIHKDIGAEALVLLYNAFLNSFVNSGLINKAYCLLKVLMGDDQDVEFEIHKFLRHNEMSPPNTTSFTIVINGLLKAGDLDLALSLFHDMDRIGCKRDLQLYNNIIDGLSTANRLDESYELLREMKESGIEPTHFTHNALYGCLCRRKNTNGAIDLVKNMRAYGHEPWIKHTTTLVKELCKHGEAKEAFKFLTNLLELGFIPDIVAYSAYLDGLVNLRELDLALKLFQDICARGYYPDVVAYNTLVKGFCKAQRMEDAQCLINEMMQKGLVPSVRTYNLLIDGWCKMGNIDQAMLCLSVMSEAGRGPSIVTYTTIIDGLFNTRRPEEAVVLWDEMKGKGCKPSGVAFMALIYGLCKCGQPSKALFHLSEMVAKGMKPDTYIYVELIRAFLVDSNLPSAYEILKEMVDKGAFPHEADKNYTFLKEALLILLEDARTSSDVKNLIDGNSTLTLPQQQ